MTSYVLQKMNDSATFTKQPNWLYYYFSAAADVNGNPTMINGSAFYFDNHCHYPNWYTTVEFNRTLPLFGPKAYRQDNTFAPGNNLREPNLRSCGVRDAGAGISSNYTHPGYKMNPWYYNWLPDLTEELDSLTKYTYHINIRKSNITGRFVHKDFERFSFFGPASPGVNEKDERKLPVTFTGPYFDCGGSNQWVVSALSPVADYMPRYSNFTHMRRSRFIGVIVTDIYFLSVDFNPCGIGKGNNPPNYLAGVAKCTKNTGCKTNTGHGFHRGGYKCRCNNGWRYPWYVEPPYQGVDIEQATEDEYKTSFVCFVTGFKQVLPVIDSLSNIHVEGGSVVLNTGGIDTESDREQDRFKRSFNSSLVFKLSSDNYPSKSRLGIKADKSAVGTINNTLNQLSEQEVLKSKENGLKFIQLLSQIQGDSINSDVMNSEQSKEAVMTDASNIMAKVEAEFVQENNVDIDVERRYRSDMKKHKELHTRLVKNGVVKNNTQFISSLESNALQLRNKHMERYEKSKIGVLHRRSKRSRTAMFDQFALDRMLRILRQKAAVTSKTCSKIAKHLLYLPGDVIYGVEKQFDAEAGMAVRLTHFLSMYLQNVAAGEDFGNLRGGGRLHEDELIGEVLSIVMGNHKIYSAGLYFDRYKFEQQDGSFKELFGPFSYMRNGAYYVEDTAGYSTSYTTEDWFKQAKSRFATNFHKLKTHKVKAHVRSDPNGTSQGRHEFYPMTYKAADYSLGYWTRPRFRCDQKVNAWVITYVSPFFSLDPLKTRLVFSGVVTVDIPLDRLEINQCPAPFTTVNAFKNTARCDYYSTYCTVVRGFYFLRGAYGCRCRLGFEYMHNDRKKWLDGTLIELEFEKKRRGLFSRFDQLKCRPASAQSLTIFSSSAQITFMYMFYLLCNYIM